MTTMRGQSKSSPALRGAYAASRWLGRTAPLVSIAVFLAAALLPGERSSDGSARHDAIAAALSEVPQRLGRWVGADVPVPTEATEILQANALLSRDYREVGGSGAVTLAIIHCRDARDMVGHYPPVCYPASGWTLDRTDDAPLAITVRPGVRVPIQRYRFVRADRLGGIRTMTVLNTFLLPDGATATDMRDVTARSERRARSAEGVAQLQLVFSGDVSPERTAEVAEELLLELPSSLLEGLGLLHDEASSSAIDSLPIRVVPAAAGADANGQPRHMRWAIERPEYAHA